jgi:hypothetical protein
MRSVQTCFPSGARLRRALYKDCGLGTQVFGLRTTYTVLQKRTQNPLDFIGDREKNEPKLHPNPSPKCSYFSRLPPKKTPKSQTKAKSMTRFDAN